MDIRKVGVVGAGTMGNGIAQAFSVAGYEVVMTDVADAALERGLKTIGGSLDRLIKKEKMTEAQKEEVLGRVSVSTDLGALATTDLVVEAATENLELKLDLDPERPSLDDLLDMITAGLRSSMTYAGASTLSQFAERAVVGTQSAAGYDEGKALHVSW